MIRTELTDVRRRWNPFRRRRFSIAIPENWEEVDHRRRTQWWAWLLTMDRPAALRKMVSDLLPGRLHRLLTDLDIGAFAGHLAWVEVKPDCAQLAMPSFVHKGVTYHFPKAKGSNLCCLEYPVADQFYVEFYEKQTTASLLNLLATLAREANPNTAEALANGDVRVPLLSSDEARARAARLSDVAPGPVVQALMYFGGLKEYIARVYGPYLFDDDKEEADDEEENPETVKPKSQPDFGWWGTFQHVAESGVFGNLRQVYQSSLHEVCVFLVRKRIAEDAQRPVTSAKNSDDEDGDLS